MIIPLNIVMTYPVHWGKYSLFRDFIQNFYDSVGYKDFASKFKYSYKDGNLEMMINEVTFSYEWLLHIGASTKTATSTDNAGYFGEGFKIASLCAYRDFRWNIVMSSANWELTVISKKQQIDGNTIDMLAYDVRSCENRHCSVLKIYPIEENDFRLFKNVVSSFYYPQNPLIGEIIWEGKNGAVYTRSKEKYNENLPYTTDFGRKGAVFCSYQLLGSNPFDLVICAHHYKKEDRERHSLYAFDVVDVFKMISYSIDPNGAILMLEKMRRYWGSVPHKKIDIYSWYPVICNLIRRISNSSEAVALFREKHPNLLCLKPMHSIQARNRRWQARAWLNQQEKKYVLVQDGFAGLGYNLLEDECEINDGFVCDDIPNDRENEYFKILEDLTKDLYKEFFNLKKPFPERRIISNDKASYGGMIKMYPNRQKTINNRGIYIRNTLGEIYLKKSSLRKEKYYDALSTYIHEMCHMFGGDSSNNFSQALTFALEILLANSSVVNDYKEKWEAVEG